MAFENCSIQRAARFWLTVSSLLAGTACADYPAVPTRPLSVRPSRAQVAAAAPRTIRPEEQAFADLAVKLPSSGGYFVDAKGVLVLWVQDSADDVKARGAAASEIARLRAVNLVAPVRDVEVRRARYTFMQLAAWRDAVFDKILTHGLHGVFRLDLNETTNRVDVRIDSRAALSSRAQLIRTLDSLGVDTGAITISTGAPKVRTTSLAPRAPFITNNIYDQNDTIVGGIKFSYRNVIDTTVFRACTLGTVLDFGGTRSFLTASHCSSAQWQLNYDRGYQATSAGAWIDHESADPTPYTCGIFLCRPSDASVYALESGVQSRLGLIAKTQSSSSTWGTYGSTSWDSTVPYFVITWASCECVYGQTMQKIGVTTGWTTGTITSTCLDENIDGMVTTCAMETTLFTLGGDSGSPVFNTIVSSYDTDVNFAGIMFASDTASGGSHRSDFSTINRIASDLGSTWQVVRVPTLTTPSWTGEVVGGVPGIAWSSITGASYYQVWRQWYRYPSETGSNGWEYLGHLSSEFWDSQMNVDLYTGTTVPNFSTEGYVEYKIVAGSQTERSSEGTIKYFRLAPP